MDTSIRLKFLEIFLLKQISSGNPLREHPAKRSRKSASSDNNTRALENGQPSFFVGFSEIPVIDCSFASSPARPPFSSLFLSFSKGVSEEGGDGASFPPTTAAAREHSLRAYLQVQLWGGFAESPLDWGWKETKHGLFPVTTHKEPAPTGLLCYRESAQKGDLHLLMNEEFDLHL
ncbi:hypothetical protein AVEN_111803-1 [Araneus ventricosus]|uniref:Uncharacterized protein n=1 Tax=Araneus ventricosus TaxID=182803 RepID=A0A4Y2JV47_ARAVE|nr:hypothetical protein AVEN_111803-1 [Araneus ventricosus]